MEMMRVEDGGRRRMRNEYRRERERGRRKEG
jgi:hypothetical protein